MTTDPFLPPALASIGDGRWRLEGPGGARVDIDAHGAQVLSWRDASGRERLFLSPNAIFAPGQPIRGGVPVVFPQFAARGALPKHGFARVVPWTIGDRARLADGRAALRFHLRSDDATRAIWPHDFEATLDVSLGVDSLSLRLGIRNPGDRSFAFTAALHSYLSVDLADATLHGLAGRPFEDAAGQGDWRVQSDTPVRFDGELDRVYPEVSDELALESGGDRLRIRAEGFRDVVVWNPGARLSAGLVDLGVDQHLHFVCVEAAAVLKPVVLAPGQAWWGSQHFLL